MKNLPLIAITMGDPGSIGPEITVKALAGYSLYESCRPLVVGDAAVMARACPVAGHPEIEIHPIESAHQGWYRPGVIDVLDLKLATPGNFTVGKISQAGGEASFRYVEKAIALALEKEVAATVTNAISKEAIHLAGHSFSGHTEIYAHYSGAERYTMLLVHEELRVVHVSTHMSLREACDRVKRGRVLEVIEIACRACKGLGIENPRVGVAGLNPHSGENGLFGREELDEIIPAIEEARQKGILTEGPVPPDTLFSKARGGWYDIVVAMYHDQGHIPLKTVGFVYNRERQGWDSVSGVNITLGLPIIRTSVDHGTAFDQAGKGTASPESLQNAIDYAVRFARNSDG